MPISIHVPREGHDGYWGRIWERVEVISIHVPREGHDTIDYIYNRFSTHFNPRAPRGARPCPAALSTSLSEFQSTCPARGTTNIDAEASELVAISIHVPREGHDVAVQVDEEAVRFQSTCPARGTTGRATPSSSSPANFNPRAPRGARLGMRIGRLLTLWISIHVPREGHDLCPRPARPRTDEISIHVPREGHDGGRRGGLPQRRQFQSTCPARGTTGKADGRGPRTAYFNPRAPRGARHVYFCHI